MEEYIDALPEELKPDFSKLRETVLESLPEGFQETMQNSMPSYVVPLERFPQGYHVKKDTPLPFLSMACQKNHVAFYHAGIYMDEELKAWFEKSYAALRIGKLNMGKSCIRFKHGKHIPYKLLGDLLERLSMEEFIALYQANREEHRWAAKHPTP